MRASMFAALLFLSSTYSLSAQDKRTAEGLAESRGSVNAAPSVRSAEDVKVVEKLGTVMLPEVMMRGLPFDQAIAQLTSLSRSYDRGLKGVNMMVLDSGSTNPPVNLVARNILLGTALEVITKRANFTFEVKQGVIEIRPDSGSKGLETDFFPLSDSAAVKMTGVSRKMKSLPPGSPMPSEPGYFPQEMAVRNFFVRSGIFFDKAEGSDISYDGNYLVVTHKRKDLDRVREILRRYSGR